MTQNAQHTPGPWKLVKNARGWFLKTKDGCVLGGINRFPETAELANQCEPNARLIAASPVMAWTLQTIIADLTNNAATTGEAGRVCIALAQAALAKAGVVP